MRNRGGVLAGWVVVLLTGLSALGATVESIPEPTPGSWSVDTTRTLRAETIAEVNRLGTQLDDSGKGQLALVVVDTTEGREPHAFATELFNRWGIGHAERDDGALLFVALTDRKAEIVLGNGVDSAEHTRSSDAVMERILPFFKSGDPDGAVLEGTRGLSTLLGQPVLATLSSGGVQKRAPEEKSSRCSLDPGWGVFLGIAFILWLVRTYGDRWGGGGSGTYFGGGGGYSGGSDGGGGGFGGGDSSGGGSSGGW